jgi:pimeloyl-ACP methyl ester carboxylesterase
MKVAIVILHGWGLSKKTFFPLEEELFKRGYNAIALDFPGFGESKIPQRPWHLDDYAQYLYSYFKKENIKYPVLIGHSFGGRVCLRYSTLYPKNVRAIILSGTPGYTPVSKKKLLLFTIFAKIGKIALSFPILSFFSEKARTWYYNFAGAREYARAQGVMKDTFKNIVRESLIKDMKRVLVPCLLLWGELDRIVPVCIGRKMKETIPGSVFEVIKGADHGVPFKRSKEFADTVEEFLKTYVV